MPGAISVCTPLLSYSVAVETRTACTQYVIRGGVEGKRRLELLGRTMWPTTYRLLRSAGLCEGMTAADLGCGGGDVTRGMARMVGSAGCVVGIDIDDVKLAQARAQAEEQGLDHAAFRQGSVYEWSENAIYDRVYTRFLLTHLPDRLSALARMRQALKPGGRLIVEDIDFTGSFCYPACRAYDHYVGLYREVVRRRKGDADIGPKLYELLTEAGFIDVQMTAIQLFHITQEGKAVSLSTLINIGEAVLAESLATPEELNRSIAELEAFTKDPTTVVSLPRVFQAVGIRA